MSAYEELVERCENACYDTGIPIIHNQAVALSTAVLAEVLRTLSTVTPEMEKAWHETPEYSSGPDRDWPLMLRASPLTPPNA